MDLSIRAKELILGSNYLTLATSDANDTWVAPLGYACDENFIFYFISEHQSRHALHIAANPNVAFAIYDSTLLPQDANGLQVSAHAGVVATEEIPHAISVVYHKFGRDLLEFRFPNWQDPTSYLDLSKFRIYKLTPTHFYMLDPEIEKSDKRIEIKL